MNYSQHQPILSEKPERKKLRLGPTFNVNSAGNGTTNPAIKSKTNLKKQSQPYSQMKEQHDKEKVALAGAYWDSSPSSNDIYQDSVYSQPENHYATHYQHNLYNPNKFGSHMDEITFDEEEFNNDPEKYMQNLPEECLANFEDHYFNSHIDEIIKDLDEEREDKFEEKAKSCTCIVRAPTPTAPGQSASICGRRFWLSTLAV